MNQGKSQTKKNLCLVVQSIVNTQGENEWG